MDQWNALFQRLQQQVNGAYARLNQIESRFNRDDRLESLVGRTLEMVQQQNQAQAKALARLTVGGNSAVRGARDGLVKMKDDQIVKYIDQIPGSRIHKDFAVAITVRNNVASTRLVGTYMVPQDGPFIATARFAAFRSDLTASYTDPDSGAVASFQGRSYGRWRPVHSVMDYNDAGAGVSNPTTGKADPGDGTGVIYSPSNHSSFRTMEFDGTVEFQDDGSQVPRQNIPIPTAWYVSGVNEPFQLGALDFFERGTTMQWYLTPGHANNPGTGAGNVSGFGSTNPNYPFPDSQYDVHEGILDPEVEDVDADPVSRDAEGTFYIGFHGFQIRQPIGFTQMT